MNFKGLKYKLARFRSIFNDHWLAFVTKHSRYNTHYYHGEIKKMLNCGSEASGFAVYECLSCGDNAELGIITTPQRCTFCVLVTKLR